MCVCFVSVVFTFHFGIQRVFDAFIPLAGCLSWQMSVGNMFWCVLIALRAEFFPFNWIVWLCVCMHTAIALVIIVLFRTNSYAIDKISYSNFNCRLNMIILDTTRAYRNDVSIDSGRQ